MLRTFAVAIAVLVLASSGTSHASPAEAISAAEGWLDQFLNSDSLPVPSKKAPLHYGVFPYAADACGPFDKKRVDKITSKKAFNALASCLSGAIGNEEEAESTWEGSDVERILVGFDDAKQAKKIRKATKNLEIVALEVRGTGDAASLHVFFAIDKKGNVRGVFMYLDAAG